MKGRGISNNVKRKWEEIYDIQQVQPQERKGAERESAER